MFLHCDTSDAPWTVIKSDCKERARLNAIGAVDPLIVGRPSLVPNGIDNRISTEGSG